MNALDTQVGGDHYKSMPIQPMEYSMANKLDACQHTIIKYVTRFRQKGGIQDLEKARHVIDMLIEFERRGVKVGAGSVEVGGGGVTINADVSLKGGWAPANDNAPPNIFDTHGGGWTPTARKPEEVPLQIHGPYDVLFRDGHMQPNYSGSWLALCGVIGYRKTAPIQPRPQPKPCR